MLGKILATLMNTVKNALEDEVRILSIRFWLDNSLVDSEQWGTETICPPSG